MTDSPFPLLFTDALFLDHQTGAHPESPERLRYLHEFLTRQPVAARFARGSIGPAQPSQLEPIHDPAYVDSVRQFAAAGGGRIEDDTVVSLRSFDVACAAA